MKIIAVDDEKIALDGLIKSIKAVEPNYEVAGFRFAEDALDYAKNEVVDIAFLDIEMYGMSWVELGEKLIEINPNVNIIFSTGYGKYREVAFDMHASGYLVKPITEEKVRKELKNLRRPISEKKLKIKTFGNFEVKMDGKLLDFKYRKSKEILAYLVDRNGTSCTVGEVMSYFLKMTMGTKPILRAYAKT